MNDKEITDYYYTLMTSKNEFLKKYKRNSTFWIALNGAREFSGKNIKNGSYEKNEFNEYDFENELVDTKIFNSILLYSIVLEQLGCMFSNINNSTVYKGIKKSLLEFSNKLSVEKAEALYQLRNSLAHKFGLATEIKGKNSHKFQINISDENDNLVILPSNNWNDFSDKKDETYTIIYAQSFFNLTENIIKYIINALNNNFLKFNISIDEINSRYTII